jgi:tetratricopeptide (TPR) repeat protein
MSESHAFRPDKLTELATAAGEIVALDAGPPEQTSHAAEPSLREEAPAQPVEAPRPARPLPDYRRFKAALRAQPAEVLAQMSKPALRPGDIEEGSRWRVWRGRTVLSLRSVLALACGLAVASFLLALFADLDAARMPGSDASPSTVRNDTAALSDASRPAGMLRATRPMPPVTIRPAAVDSGDDRGKPASQGDGSRRIMAPMVDGPNAVSTRSPAALVRTTAERSGSRVEPETATRPGSDDGYALAHRLAQAGDLAAAERAFRRVLDQDSGPAAAYELGHLLERQGRYVEATASYERAAQLAPDRAYIWYDLGSVLSKQRRLDEAAASFARAAALDRTNPFILYDWGWALERTGAIALARDKYRNALKIGAGTTAGKNADARLQQLSAAGDRRVSPSIAVSFGEGS